MVCVSTAIVAIISNHFVKYGCKWRPQLSLKHIFRSNIKMRSGSIPAQISVILSTYTPGGILILLTSTAYNSAVTSHYKSSKYHHRWAMQIVDTYAFAIPGCIAKTSSILVIWRTQPPICIDYLLGLPMVLSTQYLWLETLATQIRFRKH